MRGIFRFANFVNNCIYLSQPVLTLSQLVQWAHYIGLNWQMKEIGLFNPSIGFDRIVSYCGKEVSPRSFCTGWCCCSDLVWGTQDRRLSPYSCKISSLNWLGWWSMSTLSDPCSASCIILCLTCSPTISDGWSNAAGRIKTLHMDRVGYSSSDIHHIPRVQIHTIELNLPLITSNTRTKCTPICFSSFQ